MTDTPWTPGPWMPFNDSRGYPRAIRASDAEQKRPGSAGWPVRWNGIAIPSSAEGKANARLIAAAPEMAAVLSGTTGAFLAVLLENMAARLAMLGASEDDDLVVEARSRATKTRAILARIKGETP